MPADDPQGARDDHNSGSQTEGRRSEGRTPVRQRSFSELIDEFVGLVITYVKQETLDPIRSLRRFIGFGFAAAMFIALGWAVLALTVTRLLQAETTPHLTGNLSWVPYLGGVLTAAAGVYWAISRIAKEQK
jgi:hypothetical protein